MKRTVVLCGLLLFTGLQSYGQLADKPATPQDSALIKQLFFAGLRDKLKENYAKSNESFGKITVLDPKNSAAWYEIGLLNFRQNNIPAAESAIKTAVSLDQDNLWYWKLLAEVYKNTGNMAGLVPVFDQLIRLSPDQQNYYFDRANALYIGGKKDSALAAYNELEKRFGPSGSLNRARERINKEDTRDTSQNTGKPLDELAAATLYFTQKNYPAAGLLLEKIGASHQNDPLYFALYGDVWYETGNLPAALFNYQNALKLTDQLYGVWEKVINIQILMGKYKEMIETGNSALSVYPNQAILYYYMAFALHHENQNKEALIHIKTALSLDNDNTELQALISALRAEILIDEGKMAEADLAFQRAISLDPDNFQIVNNYAYYLALKNEHLDKAVVLIERAAQAMPGDASIADTYALILLKKGNYQLAQSWIEKALGNKESGNNVYLEHYGDILFLKGEQDKAIVQWKKSQDAGNDSALLKRKINEKKYFK